MTTGYRGEPPGPGSVLCLGDPTMSWTLAVCAEMVFTDLPFEERVRRIHDLGFAVEIWDWTPPQRG